MKYFSKTRSVESQIVEIFIAAVERIFRLQHMLMVFTGLEIVRGQRSSIEEHAISFQTILNTNKQQQKFRD